MSQMNLNNPGGGHVHHDGYGAWTVVAVILVILLVLGLVWAFSVGFGPEAVMLPESVDGAFHRVPIGQP